MPGSVLAILAIAVAGCTPTLEDEPCVDGDPSCSEEVTLNGHYVLTRVGEGAPPGIALEGNGLTLAILSGTMDLTTEGEVAGSLILERADDDGTSMETNWFAGTYQAEGTWIEFDFSVVLLGDERSDDGSIADSTLSFIVSATDGELSGNVFVFFTLEQGGG